MTKLKEQIKSNAERLQRKAKSAAERISDEGAVLGWRGFHMDLDDAEEALINLRLLVRGISPDTAERSTDSESNFKCLTGRHLGYRIVLIAPRPAGLASTERGE